MEQGEISSEEEKEAREYHFDFQTDNASLVSGYADRVKSLVFESIAASHPPPLEPCARRTRFAVIGQRFVQKELNVLV